MEGRRYSDPFIHTMPAIQFSIQFSKSFIAIARLICVQRKNRNGYIGSAVFADAEMSPSLLKQTCAAQESQ